MVKSNLGWVSLCALLVGCNVSSPPASTGGVTLDGGGDSGACERAVVIVTSDFKSTNIAISSLDGVTQSPSFVSSGATKPGLALALSSPPVLLAANFSRGTIDVFDTNYASQTPATGAWTDPSVFSPSVPPSA